MTPFLLHPGQPCGGGRGSGLGAVGPPQLSILLYELRKRDDLLSKRVVSKPILERKKDDFRTPTPPSVSIDPAAHPVVPGRARLSAASRSVSHHQPSRAGLQDGVRLVTGTKLPQTTDNNDNNDNDKKSFLYENVSSFQ